MLEEAVRHYFMQNYTYREILLLLYLEKNITISLRCLERILQRLGLKRRRSFDVNRVQAALLAEMAGSGQRLGCRSMVQRLLGQHGISIGRERVLRFMRVVDPEGVEMRRRHCLTRRQYRNSGPNFIVHIDGYDKLKRYGFAIHGAICGFSRKVLWLKVNRTNNDPAVVASYYIDFIREITGVPRCIRVDAGTENVMINNMQQALRWFSDDAQSGENSVIIGSSLTNQRIESWWRQMRQMGMGFWIDYFKDLDETGVLSTAEPLHVECLRFCFTQILQKELEQLKNQWNLHRVRSSTPSTIAGKPNILYDHPEVVGARDYKFTVQTADIDALQRFTSKPPKHGCLDEYVEDFQILMERNGKDMPENHEEALSLYRWLIQQI